MCILGWHGQGIDENKSRMHSENGLRLFIITCEKIYLVDSNSSPNDLISIKPLNYRVIYL